MTPLDEAAVGPASIHLRRDTDGRLGLLARRGVAGLLAAGVSLGVAQAVTLLTGPDTSPILTVGGVVIDGAPQWAKAFAIATFGSADKIALLIGIGGLLALAAVAIGLLAGWRLAAGLAGIAAFGAIGGLTALARPGSSVLDAAPAIVGAVMGAIALVALIRSLRPSGPPGDTGLDARHDQDDAARVTRRRFLGASVATAAVAAITGGFGVFLSRPRAAPVLAVPTPDLPAPPIPTGAELGIDGLSPFVTPARDFYRVDTALSVPDIDIEAWRLRVHGQVDQELTLRYADLLDLPLVERDITLACVSNPIGGEYVGNARWIGTPLAALLEEAGIRPGADQIVSRSIDGMSIGTPTRVVMDGRDALLAVAINGEPLSRERGYPVRMIVPGLYGYVSATKWLTELELTTFDAFDPYWVERGWAVEAPIKTMSRIDTPRPFAQVPAGTIPIAGVAWAPHRGIERVEVRVDSGPWMPARLAAVDTIDTWRQWVFDWAATPGRHDLSVRATDGSNQLQPEARAEPFPSGATGWHTVVMTVV